MFVRSPFPSHGQRLFLIYWQGAGTSPCFPFLPPHATWWKPIWNPQEKSESRWIRWENRIVGRYEKQWRQQARLVKMTQAAASAEPSRLRTAAAHTSVVVIGRRLCAFGTLLSVHLRENYARYFFFPRSFRLRCLFLLLPHNYFYCISFIYFGGRATFKNKITGGFSCPLYIAENYFVHTRSHLS